MLGSISKFYVTDSMGSILVYDFFVTGDCTNVGNGGVSFSVTGDSPGWAVFELSSGGTLPSSGVTTYYQYEGLKSGTYFLEVLDAAGDYRVLPLYISSGTSISIESEDTTCGINNGSVTASTEYVYGEAYYILQNTNGDLLQSGATNDTFLVFQGLSADTYFITGSDGGGCSGNSATFLIQSSTTFDYGYYVVANADCYDGGSGKIFITGLTPSSAYTYNWQSDVGGQTGDTITGLTQGIYYVEVINPDGCATQKPIVVPKVPTLNIAAFIVTNSPTCFTDDGVVDVIITGGTAPYFYSAYTGQVDISFSTSYSFTGLAAGYFAVSVTDAGLCTTSSSTSVDNPNTFSNVDITTTNSTCASDVGSIQVVVDGGSAPLSVYDFIISGNTGFYQTTSFGTSIQQFDGLPSGDYNILVSDQNGCVYTGSTTINNTPSYIFTASTTGTTCGFNNGIIDIFVSSGGTLPYNFTLTGPSTEPQVVYSNLGRFENLKPGTYDLLVSDSSLSVCSQIESVYISPSSGMFFDLFVSQPIYGDDGIISIFITRGTPPFTINWTGDTGTLNGLQITGASSGVYQFEITDSDNCTFKKDVILFGTKSVSNYRIYNICDQTFQSTNIINKKGIRQMFWEGYYDLTSGDTNCVINDANFIISATVGSENKIQTFYTSSGFTDYPSDFDWGSAIVDIMNDFVGISDVSVDVTQNRVTITSDCSQIEKNCKIENINILQDKVVNIDLIIEYDISCVSCS